MFVKTKATRRSTATVAEGNLYKLSPISPDGVVTPITNFTGASVSDPAVSFDGKKILFSMRPPGGIDRNIYEIDADGTGLRQVTSGGGHDFDPLYLPDGRILFTSSRADEMDEYNHAPTAHLYTCDMNGSNMRAHQLQPERRLRPRAAPERPHHLHALGALRHHEPLPAVRHQPRRHRHLPLFGPHDRNFFHPTPTPDGRIIAIESTMIDGGRRPDRGAEARAGSGRSGDGRQLAALGRA